MDATEFIQRYFLRPIETGEGYNIYNTIAYTLLFLAFLIFLPKLFKRFGFRFKKEHFIELLPLLPSAGIVRALVDHLILARSWIFITPGIYFLFFFIAVLVLILRKRGKILSLSVFFLPLLFALPRLNFLRFFPVLLISLALSLMLAHFLKLELLASIALFSHTLDAISSAFAVEFFGFEEQHVLARSLLSLFNSFWPISAIKIFLALLIIMLIKNLEESDWYLFAITVLGLGPGTRNLFSLSLVL